MRNARGFGMIEILLSAATLLLIAYFALRAQKVNVPHGSTGQARQLDLTHPQAVIDATKVELKQINDEHVKDLNKAADSQ
jgi:hypothetical protein